MTFSKWRLKEQSRLLSAGGWLNIGRSVARGGEIGDDVRHLPIPHVRECDYTEFLIRVVGHIRTEAVNGAAVVNRYSAVKVVDVQPARVSIQERRRHFL